MPFWLVKLSVSPETKPVLMVTKALDRLPLLSGSVTVTVLSSVTGEPPPSNVTLAPAITVGGVCVVSSVLVPVLLVPLLVEPSVTDQLIVREVSVSPLVGSPLLGLKL